MTAESFIRSISPLLKEHGFNKSNATWRRRRAESTAVLNVQKSPWGDGSFYINLGVYFPALGSQANPTENACHVQVRLDVEDAVDVVAKALTWFDARACLSDAARLAEADSKKGLVFKEVRNAP